MGGRDVAFSKALIDELTGKLCVDRSRIFAEGFSMGGSMSYAVACALPDVVRAIGAHSGGPMSGCVQHTKPVAYFMTHGTTDNVCTYPAYGVPQVNDFVMVNGCIPGRCPRRAALRRPASGLHGLHVGLSDAGLHLRRRPHPVAVGQLGVQRELAVHLTVLTALAARSVG